MRLTVFGSSSSGNGYALEFENGKILLIEAGMPFENYLKAFPDRWGDLIGCLISHEHKDHTRFIKLYAEAGIALYGTQGTFDAINLKRKNTQRIVTNGQPVKLAKHISLFPFKVIHNAADPSGYLIIDHETEESILFITDSAYLEYSFQDVDYMMLECNYIEEIADRNQQEGRISGSQYHMSLSTCKKFLAHCDTKKTKKIILIHLSDKNSHEETMVKEIYEQTGIDTVAALPGDYIELRKNPF